MNTTIIAHGPGSGGKRPGSGRKKGQTEGPEPVQTYSVGLMPSTAERIKKRYGGSLSKALVYLDEMETKREQGG